MVHGAIVHKGALIGMNATVLDKADIGEGAIIAAGAVVTHGTKGLVKKEFDEEEKGAKHEDGTQLHKIIMQFKGWELARMEEV